MFTLVNAIHPCSDFIKVLRENAKRNIKILYMKPLKLASSAFMKEMLSAAAPTDVAMAHLGSSVKQLTLRQGSKTLATAQSGTTLEACQRTREGL